MQIYVEKKVLSLSQTQKILKKFHWHEILEIGNYKNIFDKKLSGKVEKSFILAAVNNSISKAPPLYGHPGGGYFFKNSLNCIYDCSYCYLKGAFKNEQNVFFLNYDDIKTQIVSAIKNSKHEINWFYSSDYSDNLATDDISDFTKTFIPFFHNLQKAKMEIRTKSVHIKNILQQTPTKNVEIAFSMNPSEIIDQYESKTSSLKQRITAINTLIAAWWQVGIRFIPLIECKDYEKIYSKFLDLLIAEIDFDKIYSIFIWGLLYTHEDYNAILRKQPYLDILHTLKRGNDWYYREEKDLRKYFYTLFQKKLWEKKCNICLDSFN